MYQPLPAADKADGVARRVDKGLVVAQLAHLGDDRLRDRALIVGIALQTDKLTRKFDKLFF